MNEEELKDCITTLRRCHPVISVENYILWGYADVDETPHTFDICNGQQLWIGVDLKRLTINSIKNETENVQSIMNWKHSLWNIDSPNNGLFYRASQMPKNITSQYPEWFITELVLWQLEQ